MELLVAVSVSAFVLLAVMSFYLFSINSFASTSAYTIFNSRSRYASDIISRDIRNSSSVASATTNQLVLNLQADPDQVTYTYDSAKRTLTRVQGSSTKTLLQQVTYLTWALYQSSTNGSTYGVFTPASVPGSAKFISLQWDCSSRLSGSRSNSASLQTAMIELRNR
jgi:Tfp pilus assembly protein PilW